MGKLKIARQETHDIGHPCPHLEMGRGQTLAGGITAQLVCFTETLMSNRRLVYYDLQHESSGWLFKSPLAGSGGILCWSRGVSRPLTGGLGLGLEDCSLSLGLEACGLAFGLEITSWISSSLYFTFFVLSNWLLKTYQNSRLPVKWNHIFTYFYSASLEWNVPAFGWHDSSEFLTMVLVLFFRPMGLVLQKWSCLHHWFSYNSSFCYCFSLINILMGHTLYVIRPSNSVFCRLKVCI